MTEDSESLQNELFFLISCATTTPDDLLLTISEANSDQHDSLLHDVSRRIYHAAMRDIEHVSFNAAKFAKSFRKLYMIIQSEDIRQGMMLDLQRLNDARGRAIDLGPITEEFVLGSEILFIPPTMQHICDNFLRDHLSLGSLDLRSFTNITRIPDGFLGGCLNLRSLDLSPLTNVTSIGNDFLYRCSGLQSLDLRPLRNVTRIPDGFLSGCSGLQLLDLAPLCNVMSIGDGFLRGCSSLQSLDLGPLCHVTSIGSFVLVGLFESSVTRS